MQHEINVPRLNWLIGGSRIGGKYNVYSGSIGTDPEKGFISQKIINYVIAPSKDEENGEILTVIVYAGHNSAANTPDEDKKVLVLPLEEESREKARSFIEASILIL